MTDGLDDDLWGEHGRRIRFLRRVPLLGLAPPSELAHVSTALSLEDVKAGDIVCREGDAGDKCYLIESGTLVVTTEAGGKPRELARLGPGEYFGEIALLVKNRRSATVRAGTDGRLWSLAAADFEELLRRNRHLDAAVQEAARIRGEERERRAFEVEHQNLASLMKERTRLRIGRSEDNDLVFDSRHVSEHHAVVEKNGDLYRLVDLGETIGTYVNGKMVRSAVLTDGDEVWIGDRRFVFEHREIQTVVEPQGVRIDASGLVKTVKGKTLLNDISLSILPGELVAIVGGSGAGKTTLMDAISGVRPATTGRVLYNGRDFYANLSLFRNVLGYVPQDDIIHTELPLRVTLDYAAQLRLPGDTSKEHLNKAVEGAMQELNLADRADLKVERLSGGQRKRASIAVELLSEPRVFFLDEPTSGLDPATDLQMMRLLRHLADKGSTVVLTTHATKNVMLCDKIVFLAREGRLAYFGPPQTALRYFGAEAFDQIYEKLDTESTPAEWASAFRDSSDFAQLLSDQEQPASDELTPAERRSLGAGRQMGLARLARQFVVLTRRNLDLYLKNPPILMPLILQPIALSLLLIALFRSNLFAADTLNPSAPMILLFIFSFLLYLFGLLFGVQEIVREFPIFFRERMVNLGVLPYLLSKVAILAPLLVYAAIIMTILLRLTNRLPSAGLDVYAPLLLTLVLGAWVGMGFALFTSAAVKSSKVANDLLSAWIMPQVLFTGALFAVPSMNFVGRLISSVASLRWTFEASGEITDLNTLFAQSPSPIGEGLLIQYQQSFSRDPVTNWLILTAFLVLGLALAALALKRRTTTR